MNVLRTRRELLGGGAAVAGGALVSPLLTPSDALGAAQTQVEAVATILQVELLVEFAYQRVLQVNVLAPAAGRVAAAFLMQEQAHAQVLTSWLLRLGGTLSPPLDLRSAAAALSAHQVSGSLEKPGSQKDALTLLAALESVAEGAYYLGVANLTDEQLLQSAVQMMANEAQHATVLSQLLHPGDINRAVPTAFVQGMP